MNGVFTFGTQLLNFTFRGIEESKKSKDTSGGHSNRVFLTFLLVRRDGHWDDKHQAQTRAHPQTWCGQGV